MSVIVPRNVQAGFPGTVIVGSGAAGELGEEAFNTVEGHMFHQIVTQGAACIGEPARIVAVPRIHQYADGFHQGGGEHHGLAIGFVLEAVPRVDVGDTARLPGGAVHQDGVDALVRSSKFFRRLSCGMRTSKLLYRAPTSQPQLQAPQ